MGQNTKHVYASVKSYSKRGRLLEWDDLRTLAEARDLDELATRIKNTVHAEALADLTRPYTAQLIEGALRSKLAEVHHGIAKTAGTGSSILDAYYLRFIITNLKMILKGKALGKALEEIEPHVNLRAEELVRKRDLVIKALLAGDLEEAVASLNQTAMGDDIAKAATLYAEQKNLQVFDTYFDKIIYSRLGAARGDVAGDPMASRLVDMDIDFYNIMSALRGKFWGLDEQSMQDMIVTQTPGAPADLLSRMGSAATLRDAFSELSSTRYKGLIPQTENELDALAEFERSFESEIYRTATRTFTRMFSFATIIGITKLTAYEVRNLAAIAFAVEQGITPERVMPKLVAARKEG